MPKNPILLGCIEIDAAQRNWMGIKQMSDSLLLAYPFVVTTNDDQEFQLNDAAHVTNFYLSGVAVVNGAMSSGRALKLQVNAATSIQEVDAIVDNR